MATYSNNRRGATRYARDLLKRGETRADMVRYVSRNFNMSAEDTQKLLDSTFDENDRRAMEENGRRSERIRALAERQNNRPIRSNSRADGRGSTNQPKDKVSISNSPSS